MFLIFGSKAASGETFDSAKMLKLFMDMTNQCVGDALSDMLLVESVLFSRGWNVQHWFQAYQVNYFQIFPRNFWREIQTSFLGLG